MRHRVVSVLCVVLALAAVVVGLRVSVWALVLAPFLLAGALAAHLRMTPGRLFDALSDETTAAPF